MLKKLKEEVLWANLELPKKGLVSYTCGDVSGIDRERGLVVIKPSGVAYGELKPEHMVVVDLEGKQVDGDMEPSLDTLTHLVIYNNFKDVGGVVHTHSRWATIWAQSGRGIPLLGTTHADYFYGEIPCTRKFKVQEISGKYENRTGNVIVETFTNINPVFVPGVLVNKHGPFSWGKNASDAVQNAVALEEIAMMAFHTCILSPGIYDNEN
ncbi:L-ribulose-5-phosphate 4-epimerase AraD [Pseudobacteroides cellulosolvens]|uniref:L-ribulose-5-phosphate 4-epimerase AraD n=1 Tax=Pseudobacteroides cellulosolvens TaxID=35825 RepID=UPI00067F9B33|nr:L-ribulose-5-phosphate 4-epimerase AraD [Pseudobacteroides cellulosolvens]